MLSVTAVPSSSDLDDLVDRAVAGNSSALHRLLSQVHPIVVRYCRSRLSSTYRSGTTADDVAQEVCMAVLTALPTFRQEGRPFVAFVYGIAAHKVADAHRAAARSRALPVADIPDAPTGEQGPEQHALAGTTSDLMDGLLANLPENQQEIVRLRIVVGFTADETAAALGMTAGAVRVAQHRALNKLRSLLTQDAGLTEQLL